MANEEEEQQHDERIDQIRASIGEGDFASATDLLEEVLKDQPGNDDIKFMRIQAALAMEPKSVAALANEFEVGTDYYERAQYLKELANLILKGGDGVYKEGLEQLQKIKLPEAAEKWLSVLETDRDHADVKACFKNLFLYLGREHAVTKEYQPKFSSILFS